MQGKRSSQQVSLGEPNVADEEREVDIDSQLVITLYKGEREPHLECTKAGRMTGQMVMGLEGAGMMKIDNVLRAAQLKMRREAGQMQPQNTKSIENRLMQTEENSGG
jgi:hypothetical protein